MSKKKYTVSGIAEVEIFPYMEGDEEVYDKCGTLNECKSWALEKLEESYKKNKEYILNATEKALKP